jgi:hypothetical protein
VAPRGGSASCGIPDHATLTDLDRETGAGGILGLPRGLGGAALGAIGALPALALVRSLSMRAGSIPRLPGAELSHRDVKLATFAEIVAAIILIPVFAWIFGRVIPAALERGRAGGLSFEWAAAGFAVAFPLWRRLGRASVALAAGAALAAIVLLAIARFRASFGARRLWTRRPRRALVVIGLTGSLWEIALLSRGSAPHLVDNPLLGAVLAGMVAAFAALVLSGWRAGIVDRIAGSCGIPIVLAAIALLRPPTGSWLLVISLAILAMAGISGLRLRWIPLPAAAIAFAGAAAFNIYYQPHVAVDLFEEGHSLTFARQYLHGARPYMETYPVHGWGIDGGVDGILFHVLRPTILVYRTRRAIFTAVGIVGLAAACAAAGGSAAWTAVALLLSFGFCPYPSERTLLAFFVIFFLCIGLRRGRSSLFFLAGCAAALQLFFALDIGVIVTAGGLAGLVAVGLITRRRLPAGLFAVGAAAVGLGGLLLFQIAAPGSAREFLRVSFWDLPRKVIPEWGLPLPSISVGLFGSASLGQLAATLGAGAGKPLVLLAAVVITIIVLVFRSSRLDADDLAVIPALTIAAVALRGAFGRAEPGHFQLYGMFAGIPAAWLLRRALSSRARGAAAVAFLLAILALRPLATLDSELSTVVNARAWRAYQATEGVPAPDGGNSSIPVDQAKDLAELRRYFGRTLSPAETFFDFSNEPALYFLLDRRMPIPYLGPSFYEDVDDQRRVIVMCEKERPSLAIMSGRGAADNPDGVPNRIRAPLVAAYLASRYRFAAEVAGRAVFQRVPDLAGDVIEAK